MEIESWIAFAFALLVALAVPGPDLVVVVHSATRGVREGVSTAAGVITGLMFHALLAVAGATALLVSAPRALTIVQLLGAGVLLWMGTSMVRSVRQRGFDAPEATARRTQGGYVRGFLTNATNPKALLFFAAILPQFIGRGEEAGMRTVVLCVTVVLGAMFWWAIAISLVRLCGFQRSPTADWVITFLGGITLLIIGTGLLATTVLSLARISM